VAVDELVEVAALAAGGALLVDHRQVGVVELVEELVPGDRLERALAAVAGEVDAEDAGVAPCSRGSLRRGRPAATGLGPATDGIVIPGHLRNLARHAVSPRDWSHAAHMTSANMRTCRERRSRGASQGGWLHPGCGMTPGPATALTGERGERPLST